MPPKASLTIEDIEADLTRGRIYECSLRDPSARLDGLQDGENIYIDPRPAILETLFHEMAHRIRPRWSERRVTRESRMLLSRLSDQDVATWYRRYQRIKRKGRPVEVADED